MSSLLEVSLIAAPVIWGIRFALLGVVVWVVYRWSRAAAPTLGNVCRRVVSLGVVSALTVLAVVAPLNAEYGWYPTLGDLLPGSQTGRATSAGGSIQDAISAPSDSSALISGERTRPAMNLSLKPTATASGAGYQDFTVKGERSGVTGQVTVWFPTQYLSQPTESFPVIESFHGIAPAPYAVFNVVQLDQKVQRLADANLMRPALIVSPHWALRGLDNECVNSAAGGNIDTWLNEDIPAWLYSTFRVTPGRDSFNAFGMSAGGWCANMSAVKHPDVFSTAISMGGYWRPDFDPSFVPFAPGSEQWRSYDLVALVAAKRPPVAIWSLMGRHDDLAVPSTTQILPVVHPPTSLTTTVLPSGGHSTGVWTPHVDASLTWLAKGNAGFAPGHGAA